MAKKKDPVRPYFDAKHDFQASQKEFEEAAHMLYQQVSVAMIIIKPESDGSVIVPKGVIDDIRKYLDAFKGVAFS